VLSIYEFNRFGFMCIYCSCKNVCLHNHVVTVDNPQLCSSLRMAAVVLVMVLEVESGAPEPPSLTILTKQCEGSRDKPDRDQNPSPCERLVQYFQSSTKTVWDLHSSKSQLFTPCSF
jgi:hypothetical protein